MTTRAKALPIQPRTRPCACGGTAEVSATVSPYDFTYVCRCGRAGVVSWAHAKPAPRFEAPDLFNDVLIDGLPIRT
jgi:hypothetical protein